MAPLSIFLLLAAATSQNAFADRPTPDCREWRECRQLALDAAAERQFERFHDLAWRTVQKGPARDPSLMYLLARAQSLSGRPHDALVMLMRLAELGVETDAPTSEEFAAVRRLPQWPELEARLRGALPAAASVGSQPLSAAETSPPDDSPEAAADLALAPAPGGRARSALPGGGGPAPVIEDALRVPALTMAPMALAHDRASGRFVFGDAAGRRLVIVDERRHLVVDLVRQASAGFHDITAFEIDSRRGDLWVTSADAGTGATALHHLQLVSGRPLRRLEPAGDWRPARFVDVAVTQDGVVYVLDAMGPRLFALAPKADTLTLVARLDATSPSSLAPAPGGRVYVASPGGLTRVDVRTGQALAVSREGAPLPLFARVRWHAGALVGVEQLPDGTSQIVRVPVTGGGARAGASQVLVSGAVIPHPSAATIDGDAVYYVTREDGNRETIVKRIALR